MKLIYRKSKDINRRFITLIKIIDTETALFYETASTTPMKIYDIEKEINSVIRFIYSGKFDLSKWSDKSVNLWEGYLAKIILRIGKEFPYSLIIKLKIINQFLRRNSDYKPIDPSAILFTDNVFNIESDTMTVNYIAQNFVRIVTRLMSTHYLNEVTGLYKSDINHIKVCNKFIQKSLGELSVKLLNTSSAEDADKFLWLWNRHSKHIARIMESLKKQDYIYMQKDKLLNTMTKLNKNIAKVELLAECSVND